MGKEVKEINTKPFVIADAKMPVKNWSTAYSSEADLAVTLNVIQESGEVHTIFRREHIAVEDDRYLIVFYEWV